MFLSIYSIFLDLYILLSLKLYFSFVQRSLQLTPQCQMLDSTGFFLTAALKRI